MLNTPFQSPGTDFFFFLRCTYFLISFNVGIHIDADIKFTHSNLKNTAALKWCLPVKHFFVHQQLSFWPWTFNTASPSHRNGCVIKCLMAGWSNFSWKPQRMMHYFEAKVIFSFWASRSILSIFSLLPFMFWPSSEFKWRKSCNKQKHFSKCWVSHIISLQVKHFIVLVRTVQRLNTCGTYIIN